MQSKNGAGVFDADNTQTTLNHIPSADHGALLDRDGRCECALPELPGPGRLRAAIIRWWPRASTICAKSRRLTVPVRRWGTELYLRHLVGAVRLQRLREDPMAPHIRKAVAWLKGFQQPDAGWAKRRDLWKGRKDFVRESTPRRRLGRTRADERRRKSRAPPSSAASSTCSKAPRPAPNGTRIRTRQSLPRVFYLRYHGYSA